jgi:YD repeat-containing protein
MLDRGGGRIRLAHLSLPGVSAGAILIPAEDGSEVYVFNRVGLHIQTRDPLTGALVYGFIYDGANRLASVVDGDGNVTRIERDGNGNPMGIVTPGGQRTVLAVDENGYLSKITNPASETVHLASAPDGLLTSVTDPRGNVSSFTYDTRGRLVEDTDSLGGRTTLARSETDDGYVVTLTTPAGRQTSYRVERLPTGGLRRTTTEPNGTRTEVTIATDASREVLRPDGTRVTFIEGPDPRWGMLAPVTTSITAETPGGLTSTVTATRSVTLSLPTDPFSLVSQSDAVSVKGLSRNRF